MRTSRRDFYSAMWRSSAEAIGADFVALSGGWAQISDGRRCLDVCENKTSIDPPAVVARAADKLTVHTLLARGGLAVARQTVMTFGEVEKALCVLKHSPHGLVIKPAANTGGGVGVSTYVTSLGQLLTAIAWAWAYDRRILVEEQILGSCYRILVLDAEVIDVIMRCPPNVVGDGSSTVRQLIRRENKLRCQLGTVRGQVLIRIDNDLRNTITNQGFDFASYPPEGMVTVLKHVINDNATLDNVSADGALCGAILNSALRAARLVGARLAGVDLICRDPSVPLEASGGAIIEVNANPGLYYHYHPTDAGFPVTEKVLRRYFEIASEGSRQADRSQAFERE